jgi:hypothetical protein
MAVFSQTLFTFVGGHFVLFSFLTTWHNAFLGFCPNGIAQAGLTFTLF